MASNSVNEQGRPTIGIDFSLEAIAQARQKARQARIDYKVRFLAADIT